MKKLKLSLELKDGLSIRELEERYELTLAGSGEMFEADKPRCQGRQEDEPFDDFGLFI